MQRLTRARAQFFTRSKVESVALALSFPQGVCGHSCDLWGSQKGSSGEEGFGCLPKSFPSSGFEAFEKVKGAASIVIIGMKQNGQGGTKSSGNLGFLLALELRSPESHSLCRAWLKGVRYWVLGCRESCFGRGWDGFSGG